MKYYLLILFISYSCSNNRVFKHVRKPSSTKITKSCNTQVLDIYNTNVYDSFTFHKYTHAEVEEIPLLYFKRGEIADDFGYLVKIVKRRFISDDIVTEFSEPHFIKVKNDSDIIINPSEIKENREKYYEDVEEIIDFSLLHFRRRDWPEEFTEKIQQTARDYIFQSKYITIRKADSNKLIGSMRLIRSRYTQENGSIIYKNIINTSRNNASGPEGREFVSGLQEKLPIESFLNTDVKKPIIEFPFSRPGWGEGIGEVIEPGTFAIDPDYNNLVFGELWIQMLASFYSHDPMDQLLSSMGGRRFYTYGDRASRFLYEKQMGFSPMFERNNLINKNGIKWQGWEFSAEDIFNALTKRQSMTREQLVEVIQNIAIVRDSITQ